jgi:RNA polymerase sigma-70 factor (ECF subfamily)
VVVLGGTSPLGAAPPPRDGDHEVWTPEGTRNEPSAPGDAAGADPSGSTESFAKGFREAEPGSFDALYDRVAPAIYAWAALRIHSSVRRHLDPEDLVQEVWWRALNAFPSFDAAKGSFRPWVFGIATRALLNRMRHLRVRGEVADPHRNRALREPFPSSVAAEATSVSQRAARAEATRQLLDHTRGLDEEDRALFAYCALEGLSAPNAARLLGITADSAAKRWQRLRQRLKKALSPDVLPAD